MSTCSLGLFFIRTNQSENTDQIVAHFYIANNATLTLSLYWYLALIKNKSSALCSVKPVYTINLYKTQIINAVWNITFYIVLIQFSGRLPFEG